MSFLFQHQGSNGIADTVSLVARRNYELINNHRSDLYLAPLKIHAVLTEYSQLHSDDMAGGTIDFGHYGFKKRVSEIQRSLGLDRIVENLAYNRALDPALKALDQWLNSDGHRRNIENQMYSHCGTAVTLAPNGFYYFTLLLGKFRKH